MALDFTRLGSAIATTLAALPKSMKANDVVVWTAIAKEIVKEIQDNAGVKTGTLSSTGTGNLGAPVNSQNTNTGSIE
jgi:hypothetical protein